MWPLFFAMLKNSCEYTGKTNDDKATRAKLSRNKWISTCQEKWKSKTHLNFDKTFGHPLPMPFVWTRWTNVDWMLKGLCKITFGWGFHSFLFKGFLLPSFSQKCFSSTSFLHLVFPATAFLPALSYSHSGCCIWRVLTRLFSILPTFSYSGPFLYLPPGEYSSEQGFLLIKNFYCLLVACKMSPLPIKCQSVHYKLLNPRAPSLAPTCYYNFTAFFSFSVCV